MREIEKVVYEENDLETEDLRHHLHQEKLRLNVENVKAKTTKLLDLYQTTETSAS